jgi:hypothetical protein
MPSPIGIPVAPLDPVCHIPASSSIRKAECASKALGLRGIVGNKSSMNHELIQVCSCRDLSVPCSGVQKEIQVASDSQPKSPYNDKLSD